MRVMSISEMGSHRLLAAARIAMGVMRATKAALRIQSVNTSAVIPIMGVIWRRMGTYAPFAVDVDEARDAISVAASDNKVREIILLVDSPGGSVEGLSELGQAVADAAKAMPVIAIVQGMAASAAYYIASQATMVVAGKMDMVGSIGTILVMEDWSKLYDEAGVRVVPIATGPFKATGTTGTPLTPEQEAYLQGIVDAYFADFKEVVTRGRRMSDAAFEAVSDGRVFMAAEAQRLGLVDRLGTFEDVAASLAHDSRIRSQRSAVEVMGLTRIIARV